MKIFYLTYESILKQPILESQVIPLIKNNENNIHYKLIIFENLFDILNNKDLIKREFENSDLEIRIFPKTKFFIFDMLILSIYLLFNTIFCLIKKEKIIFHSRSYFPMFSLIFIKLFINVPIIFDMRGVLPEEFLIRKGWTKNNIIFKILKIFEKIFIRIADSVVVVSRPFKKYIKKNSEKKVKLYHVL